MHTESYAYLLVNKHNHVLYTGVTVDLINRWRGLLMKIFWVLMSLLFSVNALGSSRYFICGPDEDGCNKRVAQYCSCIPYNDAKANEPYCLDFDAMTCKPISEVSFCYPQLIFKSQGNCLAAMFQSIDTPPCKVTAYDSCVSGHSSICDKDGQLSSCQKIKIL
jgi:hypothetical protein